MIDDSEVQKHLKTLTVLLVDDEESTRELSRELLSRFVNVLITADNGEEGLEAYRNQSPDIVITDIQMPIMNGLAMIREIRRYDNQKQVPIFIMTAFDHLDYLKDAINLGVYEFVLKPLNVAMFMGSLQGCARRLLAEKVYKKTQKELVISRNMYAELFDFAPVAYVIFDLKGTIKAVNSTGGQLLGREKGLLTDTPFGSYIASEDDRELFSHHIESVLQSEEMQRCDIKLARPDATEIHGQLQSVAMRTEIGGSISILSSIVDGTAGEYLKKEVQSALEYAENIVETVREPLVVLNSDLKILTANHSFYNTFKVLPEETIGNFIYDVGNRQWDIPALRVLFEEILPHDTMFNGYEVEYDFPGIGRKIILLNARQIFRRDVGSHIILLAMEDITERKRTEIVLHQHRMQLQVLNEDLERRINEEVVKNREKDIILLHADKMSSIGQLAAGVAHEINNPIAFIVSNLVALKRYAETFGAFFKSVGQLVKIDGSDERERLFDEAVQNQGIMSILDDIDPLIAESSEGADRVKRIVLDLKNFARMDDSGFEWSDLNECVRSTVNLVRNEIKYDSGLTLQLGEIPQVRCSRHQISQVILNLLVNAAHSIKRPGSITVTTTHVGDYVLLSVGDNGCGMSEEVRKRIFEPFYTTKEVGKGTGLGLSISYSIIRQHHGEILVESEPGVGTTITVKLPVLSDKEQLQSV